MKILWHSAGALLATTVLAGCGGGSSGAASAAFCEGFHSGAVVSGAQLNCLGCTVQNPAAAADGDLFSAAEMDTGGTSQQVASFRAPADSVFAKGGDAGAFLTFDGTRGEHSVVINTYLAGAPAESASGPQVTDTPTAGGTGAARYLSFRTTQDFDSVEVIITSTPTGVSLHDQVYELCGNGAVQ